MRIRALTLGLAAAAVMTASLGAQITTPATPPPTARAGGNITATPPKGPLPRQANKRPDLTGLWLRRAGTGDIRQLLPKGETMPYLRSTLERMAKLRAQDDPQTNCLPLPTPRGNPYPFRLVETPTHLFILNESMHGFRQVFMDGRKHPTDDDLQPSWHGHSIGWWDGDTLVVDTIGLHDTSWFDNFGNLHSDRMHVVERFTRKDLGNLQVDITVNDPGAYSRPFTLQYTAQLMEGEFLEYICEENNQDADYIDGPAAAAEFAQKELQRLQQAR